MSTPLIALYRPQIPPNTGNIARLCVGLGVPLAIVGRAAFDWDEKHLKRAGLDHWDHLQFQHFKRWRDFYEKIADRRIVCITKQGENSLFDFSFNKDDVLLFGNETAGLPPSLLKFCRTHLRLPMYGQARSLNLSNAVAVTVYEAFRQRHQAGLVPDEVHPPRTYYK